jgi:hypothetical protein
MAEQVPGHETTSLGSTVSGAANILVLAPSFANETRHICTDLLAGDDPSSAHVIAVTHTRSPEGVVADWHDHASTPPARGHVISVGDRTATPGTDEDGAAEVAPPWTVDNVENPGNLTGLGIALSESLQEHTYAGDGPGTRLCFDSLTVLLQYADVKRAFRFLHVVTGRVKTADGVGHYHLDPAAHDQQTLATIKGLFDAIVTVDEAGEWTVQTR